MLFVSGLWVVPVWLVAHWLAPGRLSEWVVVPLLLAAAPLPAIVTTRRRLRRVAMEREAAVDEAERARQYTETMRYRVQRLTQELSDADRQARIAHQMSLLGRFVAGFMHEVNSPLAILTSRTEVLLEERREDEQLCRDLQEILKEARYLDKIAGTLLPALKKGRSEGAFEPALLAPAIAQALTSLQPTAHAQNVVLSFEPHNVPRVNLPSHVVEEVVRALLVNSLQALEPIGRGHIVVRLRPAQPNGSMVVFDVEDDGPGIPNDLRPHLFEPFVSRASQQQRSGLGLFIVASLLHMYDGLIRLDSAEASGARFVIEVPRARFTREQPYHWFVAPLEAGVEPKP
jgi:two-component system, NtrC family, sensor kinase